MSHNKLRALSKGQNEVQNVVRKRQKISDYESSYIFCVIFVFPFFNNLLQEVVTCKVEWQQGVALLPHYEVIYRANFVEGMAKFNSQYSSNTLCIFWYTIKYTTSIFLQFITFQPNLELVEIYFGFVIFFKQRLKTQTYLMLSMIRKVLYAGDQSPISCLQLKSEESKIREILIDEQAQLDSWQLSGFSPENKENSYCIKLF